MWHSASRYCWEEFLTDQEKTDRLEGILEL